MNEQDLTTQLQKYHIYLHVYNKTIIPFTLVVYGLIANSTPRASLAMSSYTTQAHGIIVKGI